MDFCVSASQSSRTIHKMNVERRQAHTLFGVVSLFFVGHAVRIGLNLHEMSDVFAPQNEANDTIDYDNENTLDTYDYEYSEGSSDYYEIYEENPCVTSLPLWSLVSKKISLPWAREMYLVLLMFKAISITINHSYFPMVSEKEVQFMSHAKPRSLTNDVDFGIVFSPASSVR